MARASNMRQVALRFLALAIASGLLLSVLGCAADSMTARPGPYGLQKTLLRDPHSVLLRAIAADPNTSGEVRRALTPVTSQPLATWLTESTNTSTAAVRRIVQLAKRSRSLPVFVLYRLPYRDCGSYSGLQKPVSASSYRHWVRGVTTALGNSRAIVIVEPDALAQLDCLDQQRQKERIRLLRYAVSHLRKQHARIYVDAGHAGWIDTAGMAARLRQISAGTGVGFSLNVSSYGSTADQISYGEHLSAFLGGSHFVIDTSRNGRPGTTGWCNPHGARLGKRPTTTTANALVDALLWVKTPGLSDGPCNGGPAAGKLWLKGAQVLASKAPQEP